MNITFSNTESLKSTTQINLYNLDNHQIASGKAQKVSVSKGEFAERFWEFPLSSLPLGIYRVDLWIGDGVAWRQYFKIIE